MVQTQRGFSYYILCDYLNPILIHHRSQSNDSTAGYRFDFFVPLGAVSVKIDKVVL